MLKGRIGLFGLNKLIRNDCAVSEVMGEVLLTTIAVLLVSSIGIFISTYDGAVDVPHTQVKEWMDDKTDTIYLEHSGGEFLKTEDFEIVTSINGTRHVYNSSEIYANLNNSNSWGLGQTIEINTSSKWGIDIKDENEIKVFLIDKPSKQVIQQLILSSGETRSSEWVTPQGEVKDTSPNGSATLLDVYEMNDNFYTTYHPTSDPNTYEEFNFSTPSTFWGISPGENVSSAELKIVYKVKDSSCKDIKLRIWDASNGTDGTWVDNSLNVTGSSFVTYSLDLSTYIDNTYDMENFRVRLEATKASDEKSLYVDYIALYVKG